MIRRLFTFLAFAGITVLGTTALSSFVAPATPAAAAGTSVLILSLGSSPTVMLLPPGVTPTAVAAGIGDGYAIGSDGNLYAWGSNNAEGALGDGSNNSSLTPVHVDLPSGVSPVAVAGGTDDGYAIGSDGNLYAWGWNGQGELGDGSTTGPDVCGSSGTDQCSWTPVKVALPAGVTPTAIATAGVPQPGAAFAIGSDGNLYAWGDDSGGLLGDGSTGASDVPVKVALPAGVHPTAIAGGQDTGYASASDGNLYAWGDGSFGELGNGTEGEQTTTPVRVSLPSGVSPMAISGGFDGEGYAIGSNGILYAWGTNQHGELGDGTNTGPDVCTVVLPVPPGGTASSACSTTPIPVSLPSGVTATALAGNSGGAAVIGSDGNIYDWGVLGDRISDFSDLPVVPPLPSGTVPDQLGQGQAGTPYAIVNVPDVAPTVTTQPSSQTAFEGQSVSFSPAANGFPAPTVQWQRSTDGGSTWSDISGATSSTLNITDVPLSDNGFEYRAVFTNSVGSATTNPATLTVNPTVAPVITTQPISQSVPINTTVTYTAAASGVPTPTVQWQVSGDGGTTWIPIAMSNTFTVTNVSASDNGNEYRAVFTNLAGTATTNAATLTVTAPPPTTSVGVPANGATLSGDVFLNVLASSPAVLGSVRFEVSGGSITDQVVSSAASWQFGWLGAWDTADVPNGTYMLQSVATDSLGQSTTSAPVTVTVDNLPLHTAVVVPASGATLSGSSAVLDATAAGTADVTGVQFEVSGGSLSSDVVGTAGSSPYGWIAEWNTTTVPNGTYTLESVATEVGGATATSAPITITVDNAPPATSVLLPANGATQTGDEFLDAGAPTTVASVNFELSGGSLTSPVVVSGSTLTFYGWIGAWNSASVPNGTYTLESVATYAGGVSGTSAPITITVSN